jgi:hypothetical protein
MAGSWMRSLHFGLTPQGPELELLELQQTGVSLLFEAVGWYLI